MKNGKFFYNAGLAFGLVAASSVFADEVAMPNPSAMTQQEREAYRTERQAGMTPEQRAEMQASHRQGGSAQGQGAMARDGSGTGGQYGRGGMGGGQGRGRH